MPQVIGTDYDSKGSKSVIHYSDGSERRKVSTSFGTRWVTVSAGRNKLGNTLILLSIFLNVGIFYCLMTYPACSALGTNLVYLWFVHVFITILLHPDHFLALPKLIGGMVIAAVIFALLFSQSL